MDSNEKTLLTRHSEPTFFAEDEIIDSIYSLHFMSVENVRPRGRSMLLYWCLTSAILMAGRKDSISRWRYIIVVTWVCFWFLKEIVYCIVCDVTCTVELKKNAPVWETRHVLSLRHDLVEERKESCCSSLLYEFPQCHLGKVKRSFLAYKVWSHQIMLSFSSFCH